jgi:ubiquitin C-terminal hydrolase
MASETLQATMTQKSDMSQTTPTLTPTLPLVSQSTNHIQRVNTRTPLPREYKVYNDDLVPRAFGFNNSGVICWGNADCQSLFSCTSFVETLLHLEEELTKSPPGLGLACVKLARHIRDKTDPEKVDMKGHSLDIIVSMIRVLYYKNGKQLLSSNQQQCANEGFILLLDALNCRQIDDLFNNIYQIDTECPACKQICSTMRDKNIQIEIFSNFEFKTSQDFANYLRVHTSETSDYRCDKCGVKSANVKRTAKLRRVGEVIVVMFNKYHVKSNKWFPTEFTLPGANNTSFNYELVSQIEHVGSLYGGHYYAYSKRSDGVYLLNDTIATKAEGFKPTANTYMLMYHLSTISDVNTSTSM